MFFLRRKSGGHIEHLGKKNVPMTFGQNLDATMAFEVTDVEYPILSLGRILESGARLEMSGKTGTLHHGDRSSPVDMR